MFRIALAQINTTVGDLDGNVARMESVLRQARAEKADLVAFPEMAVTGYPPEDLLLKDHFVKSNQKAVRALAMSVRGIAVPIRKRSGEIVGAISVSLPMGSESSERAVARALPLLREAEYALMSAF